MSLIPLDMKDKPWRQIASIALRVIGDRFRGFRDTLLARWLLWRYGATAGRGLRVSGRLRCCNRGTIVIGPRVTINSGPDQNYVGGDRRTNLWVCRGASLEIGEGVGISNSTIVARTSVVIREGTLIGGGCDIWDNDFHELLAEDRAALRGNVAAAPVAIGPHAFVGAHTVILKGVTIGEGAVIGAGSLVADDVPARELWAGRPARKIRSIGSDVAKKV